MTALPESVYERLAAVLAPVHDELVDRLAPHPGERWLDLASGIGDVSIRAARAGAEVTGIDSAWPIVEWARADAEAAGLAIHFDVGDVEYLPYDDGEFDVIASNFGFIFTADHANVAAGLARVAKPGARLGFTAWKPNPKLGELYRRFTDEPLEGRESTEWGREDHVEDMLGEDFELEFEDGTLWIDTDSGEELWELFSTTAPPVIALLGKLDAAAKEAFHAGFVELYETYRDGARIRAPRRYLLTLGTRR
ncbi:MAG: class I SAM-dependent methyltransferase [Actinomycetes bacterium]